MKEISQDGRRTRHEPRKQDLLAAAVEYVFEHGFSELSIRPLAAALGISHRTLLYHFHSKENLVVELLKEVRARERLLFAFRSHDLEPISLVEFVQAAWERFTAPEYEGYFRLFFEVYGLALQEPAVYGRAYAFSRERQNFQSRLRMSAIVAHPSSNSRTSSVTEQTERRIA